MGDIFGIGIEELIFIGILLALLFGPEAIPTLARAAGTVLNRLFRSSFYKESRQIRQQIQDLPSALARLAELEELQKNLNDEIIDLKKSIDPGPDPGSQSAAKPRPQTPASPPWAEAPTGYNAAADPSIAPPAAPPQADRDAQPHVTDR